MVALFIPLDGRLTSQNILSGGLDGTEVMEIVSPGTAAEGLTYQIETQTLAAFFSAFPLLNTTVITSGATVGSPYAIETTDTRILFNKTLASASYAVAPLAADLAYGQSILIKDFKGDAATNTITVTFTGGELCDGLSTVTIDNAYGWLTINPTPGGGSWYLS